MAKITNADQLRNLYAEPSFRAQHKQLDHLDRHCRRFIELSPFFVLSSSNGHGHADVSPRGGPAGFLVVADDHTLLLPDRPGNNRLDTLVNLLENPEVALLFLVPGVNEILRVAGVAEIVDNEDLRLRFEVNGKLPKTVVRITVREAFLHCAKAVMRARLWDPEAPIDRASLPTMGEMLKDQIQTEDPAESKEPQSQEPESQEDMVARYMKNLY